MSPLPPTVAVIEGDGIGPEIVRAALEVLETLVDLDLVFIRAGRSYFLETGSPIEEGGLELIRDSDALLKGPIATPVRGRTFPSVNLLIRREFQLYANVRPMESYKGISLMPIDLIIVRENLEGLYAGRERTEGDRAVAERIITSEGAKKISEYAFELVSREGRERVTVIHKRNVLKATDGLFLETFYDVASRYPRLEVDDEIVDAAAYKLIKQPSRFDVMVTPNLYGDILSDVAAGIVGSLGLCGSAMVGTSFAAFEPIHGSADDIAGRGIANPLGMIKASAMMLRWLGLERGYGRELAQHGDLILEAVREVVEAGESLTPDLGGQARTEDIVSALLRAL